jgi:hypothetical protein
VLGVIVFSWLGDISVILSSNKDDMTYRGG